MTAIAACCAARAADDPSGGVPWHQPECHLCLNCVDECPEHSLKFKFFPRAESIGSKFAAAQSSDRTGRWSGAGSSGAQHSGLCSRTS